MTTPPDIPSLIAAGPLWHLVVLRCGHPDPSRRDGRACRRHIGDAAETEWGALLMFKRNVGYVKDDRGWKDFTIAEWEWRAAVEQPLAVAMPKCRDHGVLEFTFAEIDAAIAEAREKRRTDPDHSLVEVLLT